MEPAPKQEAVANAPVSKTRKVRLKYSTQQKMRAIPKAAIVAAAIAAVALSNNARRRQYLYPTPEKYSRGSSKNSPAIDDQLPTRQNRNRVAATLSVAVGPECKHSGCKCHALSSAQTANQNYSQSSWDSGSGSSLTEETCMCCVQKLAEENKRDCRIFCEGAVQGVRRPYSACQHCRYYPKSELPEQQGQFFSRNQVNYTKCCCDRPAPSYAKSGSVGFCYLAPQWSDTGCSTLKPCCVRRIRHGANQSPTLSNSNMGHKKHTRPQTSYCDCQSQWSPSVPSVRKIKAVKPPKPKPGGLKVQARRIRHPPCDEDSNSETELDAPVEDVRTVGPENRLSRSPPPDQARHSNNYPTSTISDVSAKSSSYSQAIARPAKEAFPFTCAREDSTSSSTDSSKTSDIPHTASTTSTTSNISTTLSDSSIPSNDEGSVTPLSVRHPYVPVTANGQLFPVHAGQGRDPFQTYYRNPLINSAASRGAPFPISSGDFWNVRRPGPRNEPRRDVPLPVFAARMEHEGDNQPAQWLWTPQPSTLNHYQRIREPTQEWEQHRHNQ